MLKSALFVIAISVVGCAQLPPQPEVIQYSIHADVNPPGFYGVNNKTQAHDYQDFSSSVMKAGQCLTAGGYSSYQAWLQQVKEIAEQRCR